MTKRKILRQRREITRAYEIKRNALFYHSLDLGNSIRGRKKWKILTIVVQEKSRSTKVKKISKTCILPELKEDFNFKRTLAFPSRKKCKKKLQKNLKLPFSETKFFGWWWSFEFSLFRTTSRHPNGRGQKFWQYLRRPLEVLVLIWLAFFSWKHPCCRADFKQHFHCSIPIPT